MRKLCGKQQEAVENLLKIDDGYCVQFAQVLWVDSGREFPKESGKENAKRRMRLPKLTSKDELKRQLEMMKELEKQDQTPLRVNVVPKNPILTVQRQKPIFFMEQVPKKEEIPSMDVFSKRKLSLKQRSLSRNTKRILQQLRSTTVMRYMKPRDLR